MGSNGRDLGAKAVAVLASSFVILGGGTFLAAVVVLFSESPGRVFLGAGVFILALFLTFWLFRERPTDLLRERFFFLKREKPEKVAYNPRRKRQKSTDSGTPQPPSAESVRELKEGVNTWVPRGKPAKPKESSKPYQRETPRPEEASRR